MGDENRNPQINVSKIVSGGGIAGAIFAVTSTLVLLFGIPALWFFLPAAIVLGLAVALVIRFARHETPGKPWILSATDEANGTSSAAQTQRTTPKADRPGNVQRRFRELPV